MDEKSSKKLKLGENQKNNNHLKMNQKYGKDTVLEAQGNNYNIKPLKRLMENGDEKKQTLNHGDVISGLFYA